MIWSAVLFFVAHDQFLLTAFLRYTLSSTSQTLWTLLVLLTDCCISDFLVPISINVGIESMLDEIMIRNVLIAIDIWQWHQTCKAGKYMCCIQKEMESSCRWKWSCELLLLLHMMMCADDDAANNQWKLWGLLHSIQLILQSNIFKWCEYMNWEIIYFWWQWQPPMVDCCNAPQIMHYFFVI